MLIPGILDSCLTAKEGRAGGQFAWSSAVSIGLSLQGYARLVKTQAADLNRHSSKDGAHMISKHEKMLNVVREIGTETQTGTTVRCHLRLIGTVSH